MDQNFVKARLKAAGERAALLGEHAKPFVFERSGGTATVGVIFMRGHKSVEDVAHHGSWYTQAEREKLLNDTLHTLKLRGQRSASR